VPFVCFARRVPPGTSTSSPHHNANFQASLTAFTALADFLAEKPLGSATRSRRTLASLASSCRLSRAP